MASVRRAAGLRQREIARALDVSRSTVSDWERGSHPVPWFVQAGYAGLCAETARRRKLPVSSTGEEKIGGN